MVDLSMQTRRYDVIGLADVEKRHPFHAVFDPRVDKILECAIVEEVIVTNAVAPELSSRVQQHGSVLEHRLCDLMS
ncbi:hypothetical protein KIN20_021302 [Parelaphostrongylus tenuis]|uniref:Uncharacterized protein n=1 Tax=Parelaphostrongylus tenuis TaxID=148309 RepID=A0AAD5QUG3_PARTN|nr:hypothetical protein KIN20_021302 [Parelaphostrongylus tenuis]